jgi:hypothetical protein
MPLAHLLVGQRAAQDLAVSIIALRTQMLVNDALVGFPTDARILCGL